MFQNEFMEKNYLDVELVKMWKLKRFCRDKMIKNFFKLIFFYIWCLLYLR